jgi:small-conductance mechanosensitive channel
MNIEWSEAWRQQWDDPLLRQLFWAALGLLLIIGLARLLRRLATGHIGDSTARYQTRKLITFGGYAAALLMLAAVFSHQLGGFTVALGVAGAGIAFALQEVIASVAGFVAVSFGGFYRVGDRVQLGGIKGDVIDIGVLRTTLMEMGEWVHADQYNGRIVRVANSFVFKEPVYNYSGEFPFLWDEITLPLRQDSDRVMARAMIERVAQAVVGNYAQAAQQAWQPITRQYLIEHASVQPLVVMSANSNAIEFTLRYVVDFKFRRLTKDRLFSALLDELDKAPEHMALATATLNIEKLVPLEVRLKPPER